MRLFSTLSALVAVLVSFPSVSQSADQSIKTWLDRATTAVNEIADPTVQGSANDPLARALARADEPAAALSAAKGITDPLTKMYVLRAVAEVARKAGNKEVCQQAVDSATQDAIDNAGPFYTDAYIDLCFAAGMPEAAMKYADKLFQPGGDPQPYVHIIEGYAASGDSAAAEKLLQEKQLGDYGKLYIARGLAEAKNFEAAIKAAATIEEPLFANQARGRLAADLAHAGREEEAVQQASLISEDLHRESILGEVALFSSKNDSVDELRKRFAAANTRDTKTALVGPLVQKLVEVGALDEAEQAIEAAIKLIKETPRKVSESAFGIYGDDSEIVAARACHLEIAKKLIEQNEQENAAAQVAKIEPLYDALSEEAALIKWALAPQLVDVLVQLGEVKRAEAKLKNLEDSPIRCEAAVPIAVHYIKVGNVEKGLQLVAPSEEADESDGSENDAVAIALLESVSAVKSAEYLESLTETEGHARAVTNTARELVESKRLGKLEELYAAVKSPFVRTYLAAEAANRMLLADE